MIHPGDKELTDLARKGGEEAFAILVGRYAEPVFTLVRRIVGSREEAEEVTQDAFVKAWQNLERFDGRSSFRTWLWRIACNTALTAAGRRKRSKTAFTAADERLWERIPDSEVDDFFAGEADDRRIEELRQAIDTLEPRERALVTLFYFGEQPMAECARILGMTENSAKVALHRTRKKLYTIIKKRSR